MEIKGKEKDTIKKLKIIYYNSSLSQSSIANIIGVSSSTLNRWLKYISIPSEKNLYRIQKFLDQHKQEAL